jgi:TonB family protein
VAIGETFDLLDIAIRDAPPDAHDRLDAFRLVISDDRAPDDGTPEPTLAATPFFVEFDEPTRLDPERVGLVWELPPATTARPIRLPSPLVSLAIHLLPLLAIIGWPMPTPEVEKPIPVQLVFEQPPPPPPPPEAPKSPEAPKPPEPQFKTGRLSSVDQGDVKPPEMGLTTSMHPPSAGETQPDPAETQTATAAEPPPPLPIPKPAPPKEKSPFQLPKPSGAAVPQHAEVPRPASRSARYAGSAATRDEYLAYLVTLTRQHIDLLPLSYIGGRSGETVISVVVYDNGRIGPLGVLRSSGYPDIDERIERMIAAVGRFPPLPQWYQGNAVELQLTLKFPEALYIR